MILYSNIYRDIFYKHLQIDFPKIIFVDNNTDIFETLSKLEIELINPHLLKVVPTLIATLENVFHF